MSHRRDAFIVVGVLLSFWPAVLYSGEVFEEIIARINNDIITKSDYEKSRSGLRREMEKNLKGADLDQAFSAQEKDLLKNMIDEQLLVQKAADLGITADTEVIKYLDRLRTEFKLDSLEALDKMMLQQGIDPVDFKNSVKNQSLRQQVLGREVFSRLQISTEEINRYYEEHKQDFDRPEEVRIREILISTEGKEPSELPPLEKKAQEVLDKARSGEKFEELAQKYSDGSTAKEGGDLGFFPRGNLLKEIETAAFSLRRGQVSDIIRTKFGFMIIKVEEKHEAGIQRVETVTNEIRDRLFDTKAQPAIKEYLAKLRKQSYIHIKTGYVDSGSQGSAAEIAQKTENEADPEAEGNSPQNQSKAKDQGQGRSKSKK
ncbi:MAG: peptidylprolyl isomerase [Acidobacteriota bacterium]